MQGSIIIIIIRGNSVERWLIFFPELCTYFLPTKEIQDRTKENSNFVFDDFERHDLILSEYEIIFTT